MIKRVFCELSLGVLLIGLPVTGHSQETKPPPVKPADPIPQKPISLKVVYEVFSLPMTEAAGLQRAGLTDADFYDRLVKGLDEGKVKLDSFLTIRGIAGQSLVTSQAEDYTYPSEFEPPELPNQVVESGKRKGKDGKEMTIFPVTPATPTAYKQKKLGEILEVEAVVKEDGVIDLRLAPSRTALIGKDEYGQGVSKVEMPRFSVPEIRTTVAAQSGRAFYLGTVSAPAELQPAEGEEVVSFAFVTATLLDKETPAAK